MFKKVFSIFILLSSAQAYCSDSGRDYRIVSLAPNLTEIIFELKLEKYLVGVSSFSNYPEEAKKISQVGTYLQPQIEKVIRLNPTHVLVMREGSPDIKEQLTRAKINFYTFESKKLTDYGLLVRKMGDLFSAQKEANKLLQVWEENLNKFKIFKPQKTHRKVIIQVDSNPVIVAGEDTFLSDVLELCYLKNAFTHSGYARASTESIMNRKPDLALIVDQMGSSAKFDEVQRFYLSNPTLRNTKLLKGDSEKLARLTARFLPEAFSICSQAHQP